MKIKNCLYSISIWLIKVLDLLNLISYNWINSINHLVTDHNFVAHSKRFMIVLSTVFKCIMCCKKNLILNVKNKKRVRNGYLVWNIDVSIFFCGMKVTGTSLYSWINAKAVKLVALDKVCIDKILFYMHCCSPMYTST